MEVGSSSLPGTTHRREANVVWTVNAMTASLSPGGLAQLSRAPALQAGGQRFESVILYHAGTDTSSSSGTGSLTY